MQRKSSWWEKVLTIATAPSAKENIFLGEFDVFLDFWNDLAWFSFRGLLHQRCSDVTRNDFFVFSLSHGRSIDQCTHCIPRSLGRTLSRLGSLFWW